MANRILDIPHNTATKLTNFFNTSHRQFPPNCVCSREKKKSVFTEIDTNVTTDDRQTQKGMAIFYIM